MKSSADLQVQPSGAATALNIVQAFVGISQGQFAGPCDPCLGGLVFVQPFQVIPQAAAGNYYAVFQATKWQGSLYTTFEVIENGTVVQTITTQCSVAKMNSIYLCAQGDVVFPGGYSGPATMKVTTSAVSRKGATLTLVSSAPLQVQ